MLPGSSEIVPVKSGIPIGRWAGALYLVVVVTGMFSLMVVPSRLHVANDVHATLANIFADVSLLRFGIASFIVDQVAWLLLALVLFRLLCSTQQSLAIAMVAFVLASVPIGLVGAANRLDALAILTGPTVGQALG